jgi:hypothetical protein
LQFLLWPIGAKVVDKETVRAIHVANAMDRRRK